MCGQVCGQTPTFCGSSKMQAEGEDAGSNSISSKRAVRDKEGDQKGGWDRSASLGAPGCCPAVLIAGGPFSGCELSALLPKSKSSSQSSSCGGPPAWAERVGPYYRVPEPPLHQAGLEQRLTRLWAPGMGWDLSWEDSPPGIQCCPAKGHTLGCFPSRRTKPQVQPWVLTSGQVLTAVLQDLFGQQFPRGAEEGGAEL